MSDRDKTALLIQLLKERHVEKFSGVWATFEELRASTGFVNDQRIDFFAVHTWPSESYNSIAYEVKVSRGDFMKEIKHPEKRVFAESMSNESYFVTPRGLVKPEEVPDGWGLITPMNGARRLRITKQATRRHKVNWPMSFIMAMLRRAADPLPTQRELFKMQEAQREANSLSVLEVA